MKSLIIGAGQIGMAMYEILRTHHETHIRDVEERIMNQVDVLHICFPDGPDFVASVRKYVQQYAPQFTLIHSSVEVGTTDMCGDHVMHCPVRGRHPKLTQEIPAFELFVAGRDESETIKAQQYLQEAGLVVKRLDDPRATEFCKLISNVHMGLEIAWRQEVGRMMVSYGIAPSVYEQWEDSYNMGYRVTGDEQLTRPRLKADPIGGHCILQCTDIIGAQYPSKFFDLIKESNEKAKTSIEHSDAGDEPYLPGVSQAGNP